MPGDKSIPTNAELHAAAEKARERGYAPYSGFTVGAAVVTDTGEVFTGANVENASYSLSMCAERVATYKAISSGSKKLVAIALAGPADDLSPCGACRQVLSEFGGADLPVTYRAGGELVTRTLGELLPDSFKLEQ